MELEAIRVLLAALDCGTVQGAAEQLSTSRGTIRRRLRELEESVGVPLVARGLRGVTATEAGRLLAQRGRLLVEDASLLLEEVRNTSAHSTRVLRVLVAEGIPPHHYARVTAQLGKAIPELRMDVRQSADPLSELMEDTDVAVVFNEGERDGPWQKRRLFRAPERLVAHPSLLEEAPVDSVADLSSHRLLIWRSPEYPADRLPLWSGDSVPIVPHVVTADVHLLHHMALAGVGIAFAPDAGLDYESSSRDALVRLLPDQVGRERWFSIVAANSLRDMPKVQVLMAAMNRFATGLDAGGPT